MTPSRRWALAALLAVVLIASAGLGVPQAAPLAVSATETGPVRAASPGPVILNVTPWNGQTIGSATPVIAVVYADVAASVVAVFLHMDGMNLSSAGTFNASTFLLPLALEMRSGPHLANVTIVDTLGERATFAWTFNVDSDRPQILLTSPLVPLTNRDRVQVSGFVSDAYLAAVLVNLASVPFDPATGYFSTNLTSLREGLNPILVVAVDAALHQAVLQTAIRVDTTAPVVQILGPPNGVETNQSTLVVSGTIDDANATVLVNGQGLHPSPDGTWRTTVALVAGLNTIAVSSEDVAGNHGAEIRILGTFYPPWYGLGGRITENADAFGVWGSTLSLGLAGVLIFLTALILVLYLRLDRRIVSLRGAGHVPPPVPSAKAETEPKT